jgi:hypothetical protein
MTQIAPPSTHASKRSTCLARPSFKCSLIWVRHEGGARAAALITPPATAIANAYPSLHLLARGPATFKVCIAFFSTNPATAATASDSDTCRASTKTYGLLSSAHRFRVSRVPPDSDS